MAAAVDLNEIPKLFEPCLYLSHFRVLFFILSFLLPHTSTTHTHTPHFNNTWMHIHDAINQHCRYWVDATYDPMKKLRPA